MLPPVEQAAARPYLAINMVTTVDGHAARDGSAVGIGSALDRRLMYELRAEADVVLHGAGTVRADPLSARVPRDLIPWRLALGLSEQPVGAIVTGGGLLPLEHPYYDSSTLIYVIGQGEVRVTAPTVEIRRVATISAVISDLHDRGARRVVCEGGPTLNASLFAADLVDELFVTLAPKLLGRPNPLPIIKGGNFGLRDLELRSQAVVDGEVFLRYGIKRWPREP